MNLTVNPQAAHWNNLNTNTPAGNERYQQISSSQHKALQKAFVEAIAQELLALYSLPKGVSVTQDQGGTCLGVFALNVPSSDNQEALQQPLPTNGGKSDSFAAQKMDSQNMYGPNNPYPGKIEDLD